MKKINLIVLVLTTALVSGLFAQSPGSLDLSFDTDGKVTTDFFNYNDAGYSIAVQSDGKIVVGGYALNGVSSVTRDFALARYNSDGSLDISFGTSGMVTTDIASAENNLLSLAIQTDGKIVVGGYATIGGGNGDFALARYDSNGSLDNSFGIAGIVTTDLGTTSDAVNSLIIQSDGKILVGGVAATTPFSSFALARYNTNGSLDNSFDTDGMVTTGFSPNSANGEELAIQPDGKILLAGFSSSGTSDFALARYNTNGSLDNSFDGDGKLTTHIGTGGFEEANSIILQSDGKIILSGRSYDGSNYDFCVVRYNTDGSLDNSFDSDGIQTTSVGTSDGVGFSSVQQADGKIVVGGNANNGVDFDFTLVRYNIDGSLDLSFDTDGIVMTNFGFGADGINSVTLQPDLKIIAVGRIYNGTDTGYDFGLARYISGLFVGVLNFPKDNNSVFIYPNPIAQEATLEYILNAKEEISICLLDMLGKIVKTFTNNEVQEVGNHSQTLIIPEGLASGSYYLVISTPNAKVSVKIIK